MFGIPGFKGLGLNHILLELKKAIFYSKLNDLVSPTFISKFLNQVRLMIIKEKAIFMKNDNYTFFEEKWKNFTAIYDFRGPDRF